MHHDIGLEHIENVARDLFAILIFAGLVMTGYHNPWKAGRSNEILTAFDEEEHLQIRNTGFQPLCHRYRSIEMTKARMIDGMEKHAPHTRFLRQKPDVVPHGD